MPKEKLIVDELFWEGTDMYIKTKCGRKFIFTDCFFSHFEEGEASPSDMEEPPGTLTLTIEDTKNKTS